MSTALPRSATAVALLADIPSTGHVGEVRAQRFSMHGDGIGERSAAFVAFARRETAAGRKVVALYPSWRADDARRAVNFARGALHTDHIAGVPVDLAPLALSLVADQLAYLAPYLPPGMVAALSSELPRHLLAGAWLKTVSGLEAIPTSVRQHMGSYAPTVSFLAYCAPTQRVERLRPAEVARRLPFRPVQPVQLLCSVPDPTITGAFDDNLPQAIQPVATRTLPAQPLGPEYWGTAKYVEFVALSAHPQALAYAAGALRASACSWCGEPMTATPCPFCSSGSARSPLRARQTPPPDETARVSDTGTWTRPAPRTSPPAAPGPPPAPPEEDTGGRYAAGTHTGAPARSAPPVHGPAPDTAFRDAGGPPLTGTAAAWAARAANGHRPDSADRPGAGPTADRPDGGGTAGGPPAAPRTGPADGSPRWPASGARPPHGDTGGRHSGTPAAGSAPAPPALPPGAPATAGGDRPAHHDTGGRPSATGDRSGSPVPGDTAAAWAARVHGPARSPRTGPPAGPPPAAPPGPHPGYGPPGHGERHPSLEAEALPPITVDEDAWHSTVDGLPHGAPDRAVHRPPAAPGTGDRAEPQPTDPRAAQGPGPRPHAPDPPEDPQPAERAPRPENPRTYSR